MFFIIWYIFQKLTLNILSHFPSQEVFDFAMENKTKILLQNHFLECMWVVRHWIENNFQILFQFLILNRMWIESANRRQNCISIWTEGSLFRILCHIGCSFRIPGFQFPLLILHIPVGFLSLNVKDWVLLVSSHWSKLWFIDERCVMYISGSEALMFSDGSNISVMRRNFRNIWRRARLWNSYMIVIIYIYVCKQYGTSPFFSCSVRDLIRLYVYQIFCDVSNENECHWSCDSLSRHYKPLFL